MNKIINYLINKLSIVRLNTKSKHIACILVRGKCVSWGVNETRHAEANALRNMPKHYRRVTMVVLRLSNGKLAASKPCTICAKSMMNKNVTQVIYSTGEIDNPLTKIDTRDLKSTRLSSYDSFIYRL